MSVQFVTFYSSDPAIDYDSCVLDVPVLDIDVHTHRTVKAPVAHVFHELGKFSRSLSTLVLLAC